MDDRAAKLNNILDSTLIGRLLSPYGKRIFFPEGIVAQSQIAAQQAWAIDATAGVAKEHGHYISLSQFDRHASLITRDQMVSYAPTAGDRKLREIWQQELHRKNPSLVPDVHTLPIITCGLTQSLSLAAELFIGPQDAVIVGEPCWDNYELIFQVKQKATVYAPSWFTPERRFTTEYLAQTLDTISAKKVIIVVNFPHNPTGYTPTEAQLYELRDLIFGKADQGTDVIVLVDDAYFGLFHDDQAARQSFFTYLCGQHKRVLAIKCDAATKESLVWGFRIGFITYGFSPLSSEAAYALEQKTMGALRASVSSCSRIGQSLLLAVINDASYHEEINAAQQTIARRYAIVQKELKLHADSEVLLPYPYNSGTSARCIVS